MSETVIVAILSLIGTLVGTLGGILVANRLTNYRIEQLEKKVEKHNGVMERTFKLEEKEKALEKKSAECEEKIRKLAGLHKEDIL